MATVGMLPPLPIVVSCFIIWILVFFSYFFHMYLMASLYLTCIALVLLAVGLQYVVFSPVDDNVTSKIIYGDNANVSPVFAHRGASHDAPENTISAIKQAKHNGAHGVEFDISFTKDNIAVLFHDDTVDRTTNGFGSLSDMTFEEVRKLDASAQHAYHDRFKGEKIPTVEEAIQASLELGLRIIFDVKESDERAVTLMEHMFSKYPDLYKTSIVASFYPNFIYQLRRVDPKIATALIWRPMVVSTDSYPNGRPRHKSTIKMFLANVADYVLEWSIHNWLWYVAGSSVVLIHKDCLSPHYVRMWKDRGVKVLAWTVNHPVEKDYLSKWLKVPYITDTMQ
ncbi:glycerophosphodiester phosphodiesterase 1-like [Centruroides sculpturatus]|uniref:glycerophosphodiester phosphodiesterase 1-like n=1 Tax=Centruroides sculpturatus TaxID=218467 RepID=UPI000C6E1F1C|nr:glycerophosphodiester phosphodiesterase 1-like [Centruroides sculpturatus]